MPVKEPMAYMTWEIRASRVLQSCSRSVLSVFCSLCSCSIFLWFLRRHDLPKQRGGYKASPEASKECLKNAGFNAVFKMDNRQGPIVQHRELCSMLCGSLGGIGVWGRMDKHICIAEFLCCPPETINNIVNWLYPNIKQKVSPKLQALEA